MRSSEVASTVVMGNHTLTAAEVAEGVPPRKPFVGPDGVTPVDPSTVRVFVLAPTGTRRTFSWPTQLTGDAGLVQREEVGRFFVPWTPAEEEDGVWRWDLRAEMSLGSKQMDQKVFYVQRPITGPA